MTELPRLEQFGTPASLATPAQQARAAARLIRRRVTDPADRAEILAALGLQDTGDD